MGELTANVNWLAVIIGGVVSFMLGWLWYSPKLFGSKWAEGARVTLPEDGDMPVAPLVVQAFATFGLAWLVGIMAAANQLVTMIFITAVMVLMMGAGGLFSQKNGYAIGTEVGFVIAMVVVNIIVQGIL